MDSSTSINRKYAESAITESEQRYRDLIESSHDWIWEIDATGRYTYASPQVFDIFGYMPEEIIGKTPFDFMPEDEAERVRGTFSEIFAKKASFRRMENSNLHKDGSLVVLATSGVPFFDPHGKFLGYRGMDQDITERKKYENELRATKEYLEATINALPDLMFRIDQNGRILDFHSTRANELFVPPAVFIGKKIIEMLPEEPAAIILAALDDAKKNGIHRGAIYALPMSQKLMWYELSIAAMGDPGNPATNFIVLARDITARKDYDRYRAMGQDILSILNREISMQAALSRIVATIRSEASVDGVGIRLQHDDDFPYVWQEGFSDDFLAKENSLTTRDRKGGVCRDEDGNVCLECTCGLVLTGKIPPGSPLFTPGGSAWTNDSYQLLHLAAQDDPRSNPRNECIHQGYTSIALIPIRAKGQIVGLLQLNAHRKDCFTLDEIKLLEGIAESIGEAMLRKKAEAQLRHERDRAQSYLDTVETIIVALDRDGNIATANRKACQLLGYEETELIGRSWFETCLIQQPGIEKVMDLFRRLIAGETALLKEYQENPVITRCGELRHIAWHNALLHDERGQIVGTLSAGEDVTDRKIAESDLNKLYQAIEQSPASILITDLMGKIEYVNPAFCKLTGYTEKEAIGKNPRILKSGQTPAEEYASLWTTISTGKTWQGEFRNVKKNGESYWERACIAQLLTILVLLRTLLP